MISQSKGQWLVREPGTDSEQFCHQSEHYLDLGWTTGATSKVRHFG